MKSATLLFCCFPALAGDLALFGGKIYSSPGAAPITDGVVWIRDGRIATVGARNRIQIPANTPVLDCAGLTITAGFWNSHVAQGMDADAIVLAGDPAVDVLAFSKVRYTLRKGKVIYKADTHELRHPRPPVVRFLPGGFHD